MLRAGTAWFLTPIDHAGRLIFLLSLLGVQVAGIALTGAPPWMYLIVCGVGVLVPLAEGSYQVFRSAEEFAPLPAAPRPILGGSFAQHYGSRKSFAVVIACGPSQAPVPPWRPDKDVADEFVGSVFPEVVTALAYQAGPDWLRYGVDGEEASVMLWSSGLIEAMIPLASSKVDWNKLDLRQASSHFLDLVVAVQDGWFERLFEQDLPGTFDWRFSLEADLNLSSLTDGTEYEQLGFPGRTPGSAATRLRIAQNTSSYAMAELWNRASTDAGEAILRPALVDLLRSSGYDRFDGAIEDILSSAKEPPPA